jgi:hypothetical protein
MEKMRQGTYLEELVERKMELKKGKLSGQDDKKEDPKELAKLKNRDDSINAGLNQKDEAEDFFENGRPLEDIASAEKGLTKFSQPIKVSEKGKKQTVNPFEMNEMNEKDGNDQEDGLDNSLKSPDKRRKLVMNKKKKTTKLETPQIVGNDLLKSKLGSAKNIEADE